MTFPSSRTSSALLRCAHALRAAWDALTRTPYVRSLEAQLAQQRVDTSERLREKDAQIHDLRVRLAVAETDAMREKLAREAQRQAKPIPEFAGPLPWQDELLRLQTETGSKTEDSLETET